MASPDRTRTAVLAAAVVVALLAVGGLTVLLIGDDDDDGDRLGSDAATSSPTPPASATASPTPSPTAPASPTPSEPAPWAVDAAFVTPEAASAAEEPGWEVATTDGEPGPLLDPCADGDFPLAGAVAASAERAMSSEREAGGSVLAQEVFRYATEQDAAAALSGYRERVEQCPTAPAEQAPADHTIERTVVADASGEDRLLVRERYCNPGCVDLYTTYSGVVRAADGLSVLQYGIGEDGDPADGARALLEAAADALQSTVAG